MGKSSESEPKLKESFTLKAIMAAVTIISLCVFLLVHWEKLVPPWLPYLLIVTLFLLALAFLWCLFANRAWGLLREFVRERTTRTALRKLVPRVRSFLGDLEKVVDGQHQYSLSACVSHLSQDSSHLQTMPGIGALLSVLQQWLSCFLSRSRAIGSRLAKDDIRHFVLETRFILLQTSDLAKRCEGLVPGTDDVDNGIHCEPQPNTQMRRVWKQFTARYNSLLDRFRALNEDLADALPELTVFDFDKL